MAAPNKVLAGFTASMYAQTAATPTPVTDYATYNTVNAVVLAAGSQLAIEAVPTFGMDDAVATYSIAGSRTGDKIPVQASPTSMTITAPWNPSDVLITQLRSDAYNGSVDRTFVIKATDGIGTILYGFTGRVSNFQIDAQPNAEAKAIFTIHPRGGKDANGNNYYGWSNS